MRYILMFPIKQRYKNLSKSQQKAARERGGIDVSYKTKIQKFKQITTSRSCPHVW